MIIIINVKINYFSRYIYFKLNYETEHLLTVSFSSVLITLYFLISPLLLIHNYNFTMCAICGSFAVVDDAAVVIKSMLLMMLPLL